MRTMLVTISLALLLFVARGQTDDAEGDRVKKDLAEQRDENQRLLGVLAGKRFVEKGYLTRADLDRAPFGTPARKLAPKDEEGTVRVDKLRAATFVSDLEFRSGEPIPACFVLKSDDERARPFPAGFMVFAGIAHSAAPRIRVVERKTGTELPINTVRRERALVENGFPPGGYYVAAADLGDLLGTSLPPGDYEVFWSYSTLCASPARFTVLPEAVKGLAREKIVRDGGLPRWHFNLAQLFNAAEARDEIARSGEAPFVWDKVAVENFDIHHLASRLSAGVSDKYFPDPRRIPDRDDLLEVKAEWVANKDSGVLKVTFSPRRADVEIVVPSEPVILLYEEIDRWRYRDVPQEGKAKPQDRQRKDRAAAARVAPQTLEIPLPKDWHKPFGTDRQARISVIVASEPLRFPDLDRKEALKAKRAGSVDWEGVLRTTPVVVTLPKGERDK